MSSDNRSGLGSPGMEECPFCGRPFKRLKSHLPHCKMAPVTSGTKSHKALLFLKTSAPPEKQTTAAKTKKKKVTMDTETSKKGPTNKNDISQDVGENKVDLQWKRSSVEHQAVKKQVLSPSKNRVKKSISVSHHQPRPAEPGSSSVSIQKDSGTCSVGVPEAQRQGTPKANCPRTKQDHSLSLKSPIDTPARQETSQGQCTASVSASKSGTEATPSDGRNYRKTDVWEHIQYSLMSEKGSVACYQSNMRTKGYSGASGGVEENHHLTKIMENFSVKTYKPACINGASERALTDGNRGSRVASASWLDGPKPAGCTAGRAARESGDLRGAPRPAPRAPGAVAMKPVTVAAPDRPAAPRGLEWFAELGPGYRAIGFSMLPLQPLPGLANNRTGQRPGPVGTGPPTQFPVALAQRRLMEVQLGELPAWLAMGTMTPWVGMAALRRGWQRYYSKYIDVRKGGAGGLTMLLAAYCVLSYSWNYPHLKQQRWRKYH
nr:PREDICTED: uncharacterized protein C17orf80 homolog isoform X1 [Lepisosteus oculatus]XP_015211865.1 PREDICTED: uncharacterized protein C17orf80 homolog isoform X1 [Lepisosteus oculatus]